MMLRLFHLCFVSLVSLSACGVGVRWVDGTNLPIEGRAFPDTLGGAYGRVPLSYADRITAADRMHGADSCGVSFRFKTDSKTLRFRWTLANGQAFTKDRYMTQMAMGGIDVYEESEDGCQLRLDSTAYGGPDIAKPDSESSLEVSWVPGRTAIVYLPSRAIVTSFALGVDEGAKIEESPHARGKVKPIVVYGTSLIHAGCVSRPGLVFTTQLSRHLDIPVVNLGFSGSGKMEPVMADLVAETEASVFVLETLDNLAFDELKMRFEPFLVRLHGKRPEVPILICENCHNHQEAWREFARGVYDKLKRENPKSWGNLHYLPIDKQMPKDWDLTLDKCHPNDAGARFMGRAYADAIERILAGKAAAEDEISPEEMRAVYDEVKTPYKYGIILEPEKGKMLDNPNVFRHGDAWYMMYIVFDNKGYETRLAKSDDLLHWQPVAPILLRGAEGTWDCAQADGGPSLMDMRWDGSNALSTHDGKYWMTYIGGAKTGYETDPLAIGVATTDDPSAARLWSREGVEPVLAPWDKSARWFENVTLFKSFVVTDECRRLGGKYVMYYNAKTGDRPGQAQRWLESIGMAVSDDLRAWKRYGTDPVILDREGRDEAAISADPMVRKIGDKWVMFYFGYLWGRFKRHAGDTFAVSRDLVHWTKWTGAPLVAPSVSWDCDHAHKPWVIKHQGVVYHFYCAVGKRGRVLALATSRDMR